METLTTTTATPPSKHIIASDVYRESDTVEYRVSHSHRVSSHAVTRTPGTNHQRSPNRADRNQSLTPLGSPFPVAPPGSACVTLASWQSLAGVLLLSQSSLFRVPTICGPALNSGCRQSAHQPLSCRRSCRTRAHKEWGV